MKKKNELPGLLLWLKKQAHLMLSPGHINESILLDSLFLNFRFDSSKTIRIQSK